MNWNEIDNKAALLAALAKGSQEAFRSVFHAYRQPVYVLAARLTRSTDMADEVVQEVFLKVWLNRTTLSSIQQFEPWLRVVTRNAVFDALKKQAKESLRREHIKLSGSETVTDAEDRLLDKEYQRLFAEAISRLTPQQQLIFRLSRIEGLKHQQIADKTGLSPLTVKKHIAQALATIREYLKQSGNSALLPAIIFFFFFEETYSHFIF